MNELATLLIYLLIFIGIMLINYLVQRAAARQKQQDAPRPVASVPLRTRPTLPAYRSPLAAEPRMHPREMGTASATTPSRRSSARSFLRSRQDLRRAIIVMTVLGPCRAQQPPDVR